MATASTTAETQPRIEEDSEADRRWRNILGSSVGPRAATWALDSFAVENKNQRDVHKLVSRWAYEFNATHPDGLVLIGNVGVGKTHLAYAAVRYVLDHHLLPLAQPGRDLVRWTSGRDLFPDSRDNMDDAKESERRFASKYVAPLLWVIDDPVPADGVLTSFQSQILARIIDRRWLDCKATVMTANIASLEDGDKKLGEQTWDRILDCTWLAQLTGKSYRKPRQQVLVK